MINIDSEKIKALPFLTLIQSLLVTLPTGMLFLFMFKRELFLTFDYFRLIALSLAITSPVFIYMTGIFYLIVTDENVKKYNSNANIKTKSEQDEKNKSSKSENNEVISSAFLGSSISMLIIYGVLYLCYKFHLSMSFAVETIISCCVIFYLIIRIVLSIKKFKDSSKSQKIDKL